MANALSFRVGILVALSGAAGCVLRWLLANVVQRPVGAAFPAGTLVVNVLGSFAVGVVMALFAARANLDAAARVVVTSGFLGGFTTFSAFAWDTWALAEARAPARAAAYVALTLVAGLGSCVAGVFLVRALTR